MRLRLLLAGSVLLLPACSAGVDPGEIDPALGRPEPGAGASAGAQQGPERTGERLEVLTVGDSTVFAQDSTDGLCVEVVDDAGGEAVGCGFEVPERQEVGFYTAPGAEGAGDVVAGVVVAEATRVSVAVADGPAVTAETVEVPGSEVRAFAVAVPSGARVVSVSATDSGGAEVGSRSG